MGVRLAACVSLMATSSTHFNNRIRQVVLLTIILGIGFLIVRELYIFLPGLLGAIIGGLVYRRKLTRSIDKAGAVAVEAFRSIEKSSGEKVDSVIKKGEAAFNNRMAICNREIEQLLERNTRVR